MQAATEGQIVSIKITIANLLAFMFRWLLASMPFIIIVAIVVAFIVATVMGLMNDDSSVT
ncbi:MAG TPA: hypothetical protein VKB40_13815 [Candidatus Acidoferrales bacterium]|nr:hypothetical protein [Candidatus Acidoferrales bacterium]